MRVAGCITVGGDVHVNLLLISRGVALHACMHTYIHSTVWNQIVRFSSHKLLSDHLTLTFHVSKGPATASVMHSEVYMELCCVQCAFYNAHVQELCISFNTSIVAATKCYSFCNNFVRVDGSFSTMLCCSFSCSVILINISGHGCCVSLYKV